MQENAPGISFITLQIVACRLCVFYVREDNDSNYAAYIDYMDLVSAVLKKAVKLNQSLGPGNELIMKKLENVAWYSHYIVCIQAKYYGIKKVEMKSNNQ